MRSAAFASALASRLAARGLHPPDSGAAEPTIAVDAERLDAGERRLWTLARIDPDDVSHNIGIIWWFTADDGVDAARLADAVRAATDAEPVLRSVIGGDADEPRWVETDAAPRVDVVVGDREAARRRTRDLASTPFDLGREAPWRAQVVDTADGGAAVAFVAHHIAVDDRSWEVLVTVILRAYEGTPPQRRARRSRPVASAERIAAAAAAAAGDEPRDDLDFGPAGGASSGRGAGARVRAEIGADAAALDAAARRTGGSVFSLVLALGTVAVHAVTGARRPPVVTPVVHRDGTDSTVGYFGNLVPVPVTVDPAGTLSEAIGAATRAGYRALEFRDVDFDQLAARSGPRDAATLMIAVRTNPGRVATPSPLSVVSEPVSTDTSQFGLSVTVDLGAPGVAPTVEVDHLLAVVHPSTARAVARLTAELVETVCAGADPTVDAAVAEPLPAEPAAGGDVTVVEMIRDRIADRPEATALTGSAAPTEVDYRGLGVAVDSLADRLLARWRPQTPIAILCDGADRVVALLAIWEAGMAAVPVDTTYPVDGIGRVLAATGARAAVIDDAGEEVLDAAGGSIERIRAAGEGSGGGRGRRPHPESVAYLGTTSGSTGAPKVIPVSHRALAARVRWAARHWPVEPGEIRLAKSSMNFVDGVTEVVDALCAGIGLHLVDAPDRADPRGLAAAMDAASCRHLMAVSTVWDSLIRQTPDAVARLERIVLTGARPPHEVTAALTATGAEVRNSYGCAELAGDVVEGPVGEPGSPTVGRLSDSGVRVLDGRLRPVRAGVVGVVYVAGPSLAHGYLGDPAATARAFVADPQRPGERMFCTGDRGRVTETGDLAILGRPDGRMKINGVRLERAEAESALLSMPGVAAAAVVVASTDAGVDTLVGLVEATEPFDRLTTVRGASSSLPPGVAVADVRRLDRLPTLPSGKVDYGALRAAIPHGQRSEPVGAAHRTVADLAAQILGVDDVGVDADLFACGANSMHLVELSRRAREEGFAFTAADVFELRTVGALVDRFAGSRRPAGEGSVTAVSSAPSSRWFTGDSRPVRGTVACPAEADVSALRERVGRFARDVPALRRTVSVSRRGRIRIAQSEGCAVPVIESDTDTDDGAGTAVVVDRAAATLTVRASPFILDTVSARKVAALLISDGDRPEIGGAAVEGSGGVPAVRTHVWSSDGGSRTEVAARLSSYSGDRAAAARALAAAFVAVTGVRPSLDVEWRPDVETSVLGPLTDLVPADDLDAGGADQLDRRHAAVATAWGSREGRRSLSEERPADVAVMFDERWDTAHPVTVVVAGDGSVVALTSSSDCPPDVLAAVLARWDTDLSSPQIT